MSSANCHTARRTPRRADAEKTRTHSNQLSQQQAQPSLDRANGEKHLALASSKRSKRQLLGQCVLLVGSCSIGSCSPLSTSAGLVISICFLQDFDFVLQDLRSGSLANFLRFSCF